MAEKIYDAIFTVPTNIPYSQPVRYWGEGVMVGTITAAVTYPIALGASWLIPAKDMIPFPRALMETSKGFFYLISGGGSFADTVKPFIEDVQLGNTWGMGLRIGGAVLISGYLTYRTTAAALAPRKNYKYVSGPRLLEGEEATAEAQRRSLSQQDAAKDFLAMRIHPDWLLPKKTWSRHVLIDGSVGSGKSVIFELFIEQVCKLNVKCFIYDVKGAFTSKFRQPIIVCPFDRRSYVWDVAADIRTIAQAAEFARCLIPPEPNASSAYWTDAPREVLVGLIMELQITKPREWGFADLSQMLLRTAGEMEVKLEQYYPQGIRYIKGGDDNVTVQGVLSGMATRVKFIHDLARAWPKRKEKRRFSIVEWTKDDYQGRKQVIVQSGPDEALTAAYISALVNIASLQIVTPSLHDDEEGRFLGFYLDEMVSAGKLNLERLVKEGRSKGVVCVFAVQDYHNQVGDLYGEKLAASLEGMMGTRIICQTGASGTGAERLSDGFGKQKIAWWSHGKDSAAHEENKAVVPPYKLTNDLGFYKKKKTWGFFGIGAKPEYMGIKAIVKMSGKDDFLMLDWPIVKRPVIRVGQEQAKWVTEDTNLGAITKRAPTPIDPNAHLSADEMTMPIADEEEALWVKKQLEQQFPEVLASTPSASFLKARDDLLKNAPELNRAQQEELEAKQRVLAQGDNTAEMIEKHLKRGLSKAEIDPENDPFGLLDAEGYTVEPEEEEEDDEGVEGVQANAMTPKISISDLDELMNQAKLKR